MPQLGRAEVSLTIDNSSGKLPIDLAEVTITRTLFRSGDSEYAINGAPCRLLDIQELLGDSGVGRQQHMIIGQGQLDTVLNARPEDRRAIIEEAAGVLKHRRRRERAERRLAATAENLERLGDLVREVRRQIRPLERQAAAARSHDAVAAELLEVRRYLAGAEMAELAAPAPAAARGLTVCRDEERELHQALDDLDAEASSTTAELSSRREEDLAEALGRVQGLVERARGLSGLLRERGRSVAAALDAAADVDVVSTLESEAARLATELAAADAESETSGGAEQAELAAALAALEVEQAELAARWDAVLDGDPPDQAAARLRDRVELTARTGAREQQDVEALEGRLAALEERNAAAAVRADLHQATAVDLETATPGLEADLGDRTAELEEAAAAAEAAQRAADEAEEGRHRTAARAEALERALAEMSGSGGRELLRGLDGVVGSLVDLVEIDEGWDAAFEAAAGAGVATVVVDGPRSAQRALTALRERGVTGAVLAPRAGRALAVSDPDRDLPPGEQRRAGPPPRAGAPRGRGGRVGAGRTGRAGRARRRLGGGDRPVARARRSGRGDPRRRPVRRHGLAGAIRRGGGHRGGGRGGGPARRGGGRRVRAGPGRAGGAPPRARRAAATPGPRRSVRSTATSPRSMRVGPTCSARSRRPAGWRPSSTKPGPSWMQPAGARPRWRPTPGSWRRPPPRSTKLPQPGASSKAVATPWSGGRRELDVRAAGLAERRRVLAERHAEVERRLLGHAEERATAAARRGRLEDEATALRRLEAVVVGEHGRLDAVFEDLRRDYRDQVDAVRAGGERLEQLRQDRHTAEQRLDVVRTRTRTLDLEMNEVDLRAEALREHIHRDLGATPEQLVGLPEPGAPEDTTLTQHAEELERKLVALGPVNPLALDELSALEERHRELEAQVDDVRGARRELHEVVRTLDDEIMTSFAAAAADVNEHFSALVAMLFPGGTGRLVLMSPDDLLNTGVEIEVRPAGRNVRRVSLLSGGERSMAALAFLFAVFRSRPSPFYLMDEVEAALDDVNLTRFLALVREFRDEAQLVIVSHQKRTMETADALYGVTMAPGGSSQVVSQKVHEPA